MALDDDTALLAEAIRRLEQRLEASERGADRLRAQLELLVKQLAAREVLGPTQRKVLERVGERGGGDGAAAPKVRLRQYVDKYDMNHGEPVDCAALIPLCKARCCRFDIYLTTQDLDEGKLRWEIEEPYRLLRDARDGRCVYQDRQTGFCGAYEHRPATCREYSCKDDPRIWIDFDKKIPAPTPLEGGPGDALDAGRR